MNRKSIDHAKDPDLRASLAAIRRAAKRARLVAAKTGTQLVLARIKLDQQYGTALASAAALLGRARRFWACA